MLATAYANYILTFHSFLYECLEIIEELIYDCLEEKKYFKLQKVYNYYNELIYTFNKNIVQELDDSFDTHFNNLTNKERNLLSKKRKLWLEDINKQIKRISDNQRKVAYNVQKRLVKNSIKTYVLKYIIKFSNKNYRKLNQSIFEKSLVLGSLIKKNKQ